MKNSSCKYLLALTLGVTALLLSTQAIYANSTAPAPGALGELPVLNAHSAQQYSSFGPQNNLSDPDFKSIPQPVYLDKAFDSLSVGQEIQVNSIEYIFNNVQKEKNYTETLNKALTLDDLQQLTKTKLDAILQHSNYLCDAAVTWHQDTNSLTIEVTPLTLNSIDINAKDNWQERVLRHLLRVPTGEALNFAHLKSQLRLIQNNPDLTLSPSIEIVPYTHSVKFKLDAPEHKIPLHIVSGYSNLDQSAYGSDLVNAAAILNNVTGLGDSLMVSPAFGQRSQGIAARYEVPLTARLRSFIDFQWGHIHPFANPYDGYNYNGFASRITPGFKYTFFDRPNQRASVDLQMDFKQNSVNSNNDKIERESIRTLRAGLQYDHQWEKTTFSTRNEIATGLDILGARAAFAPFQPVANAGSQYVRTTGYASISRNLPLDSTLSLNTSWQYSPDSVPAFDQFCGGGTYAGRGYREVLICGDSGMLASLQWQAPAFFVPKAVQIPFTKKALRDQLQFLTFVDSGYVRFNNFENGSDPSDWILSTGFGLRLQLTDRVSGRFDLGFPLFRNVPYSNNPRIHFGLDVIAF